MNKYRVLLYPQSDKTNLYLTNLKNSLIESKNFSLLDYGSKKELLKALLFGRFDYIYLNWIENFISFEDKTKRVKGYLKVRLLYFYIKTVLRKKIIWTHHNKVPHEIHSKSEAEKIMNYIFNKADIVVVHSQYALNYCKERYSNIGKVVMVPHCNYLNNYMPKAKTKSQKIRYAFFGQVRPYKGIEFIVKAFTSINNDSIELCIYGKPINNEYKDNLIELCKQDRRIKLDLRFIRNEEIEDVFSNIDYLLLAYEGDSFLTSGSAILSFSLQTPIIAPNAAMFKDYKGKDFVLLYGGGQEESLVSAIIKTIKFDNKYKERLNNESYSYVIELDWSTLPKALSNKINR